MDISERKWLETQLVQAQKMESIGRLAGGVAHDFNNLLTAIIGYTELAREMLSQEDAARACLENVVKAAERAANLTRQLLAFARRQVIEPRVIQINDLIQDIDEILHRLIGETIELTLRLAPEAGAVRVDPGQFSQVLMNLAVNARDAMPGGGKLIIETETLVLGEAYARHHVGLTPGPYVMVAVSDTGAGIDPAILPHIFEPFYTTKETGKGTGLGLATVYGIVAQSGGHIWIYSEPEYGTTVKIYLPRVDDAPTALPGEFTDESLCGTETILLVEDELLVRDIAAKTLRGQGYTVLEAANGKEALAVAEGYPGILHLLVTDVVMPQMGGRELAENLHARRPDLRILYTSGYTDDIIVHHAVLEEGQPFLQKPFTPVALARKVREALEA
jgi:nitrogen-specific signal transduction histidine kinase